MIISQAVVDALNLQIGLEFQASLQYDAIAAHFESESLPQLARFFAEQSTEERDHAHRFMKFVLDAGGRVALPALPAPCCAFKFAKDAVKMALDQEIHVTDRINELARLASEQRDHITLNRLQWFLNEQVEEVSTMDQLLRMIERAGEGGLLAVEQYLLESRSGALNRAAFAAPGDEESD